MNIKLANSELTPTVVTVELNGSSIYVPFATMSPKDIREEVIKRVNMYGDAMDALLALVRESKSDTMAVKMAVALLNRDKE